MSAFLVSLQARAAVDVPFWAEEVRGRDHTATFFPCGTQRLACKKLPMGTPLSRLWGLGARLSVEVLYCFAPNSLPPLGQTLLPVHGALGSSLGSFSQFLLRGRLLVWSCWCCSELAGKTESFSPLLRKSGDRRASFLSFPGYSVPLPGGHNAGMGEVGVPQVRLKWVLRRNFIRKVLVSSLL